MDAERPERRPVGGSKAAAWSEVSATEAEPAGSVRGVEKVPPAGVVASVEGCISVLDSIKGTVEGTVPMDAAVDAAVDADVAVRFRGVSDTDGVGGDGTGPPAEASAETSAEA